MFQHVCSVLLIAFFVIYAIGNPVAAVHARRTGRSFSLVPLFGGLAGALGFYIYPSGVYRPWWWAPLILDIGCAPLFVSALIVLLPQFFRRGQADAAKIQQPCDNQRSSPE